MRWMRFDNPQEKKLGFFHESSTITDRLIYLNKDWREEYGGHLELWDREARTCRTRILPLFNRTVVFSTAGRPGGEPSKPHDTLFIPS